MDINTLQPQKNNCSQQNLDGIIGSNVPYVLSSKFFWLQK